MKLTTILLAGFVFAASARGVAQTVTLSVTNMPLAKVCKEIERQTGYYFVYGNDMNKEDHLVSVKVSGVGIEETLKKVFEGLPFSYQLIDKAVVINTVNKSAPKVEANGAMPYDRLIKVDGIVTSEQGQPLNGATVMIKKTGKTTLTNYRGEFSFINIPEGSVLVISYVGFSPKQIIAKDGDPIRIRLELSTGVLDDMVIKGYYTTSNRYNTGNVVTIKGEDIQKQPVSDPIMALEGRVAGLNITQYSGVPGAYATVQLRGRNSIANGLDPLYIVDGVPYSNQSLTNSYIGGGAVGTPNNRLGSPGQNHGQGLSPFNNLNPNDIESITVLKDADATAIYGSRGANGVILINTKKGKAGQTKLDISIYSGVGKIAKRFDLLDTKQYLQMRREAFKNDGAVPDPSIDFDLTYWDTTRYTDWQKIMIGNPAHFTNAQANISGGNANTQFLIGLGYSNQGTVFPGNYRDEKTSVHLSITNTSSNQRFRSQINTSYVYGINRQPYGDLTGSILTAPDAPPIYDANGNFNWAVNAGSATFGNPLTSTAAVNKALSDNIVSNLSLSYLLLPGLKISSSFGYTYTQLKQSNLVFAGTSPPPYNNDPDSRSNAFSTGDVRTWIIEPQVSYSLRLFRGILESTFGSTFQGNTVSSIGETATGFVSDALVQNPVAASTRVLNNFFITQYRYNAFYGRIGYALKEKYLLNITGRRDGSSRFGPGRQFGNFGAIGTGWIFSKESFIKNSFSWLSFGKLRASYGVTGNDQLGDYRYLDTYTPFTNGTYQGVSGLYPTQLTNPYYAWERNRKLEAAIDLGFWQDRLLLGMAFYRNRTDNQLVGYPLTFVTGFPIIQANLPALLQNTGLEFTFNSTNLRTKNFLWTTNINLSIPRNKLISYPNIQNSSFATSFQVGKSTSVRYLFHYLGVNPATGVYNFATKKGDNVNPVFGIDNYFTKPVTQQYSGGMQNAFTYKNIQLDIFVQFIKQLGNNYLTDYGFSLPGTSPFNVPKVELGRWQKYGDKTNIQAFSQGYGTLYNAYNYLRQSDATISDASFIRLKNVSLSYNFKNASWIQKAHLQSARIYLLAQNLFTITNYLGVDPETQGLILPPLRMITAGIQVIL